jgi:uncharacterized protein (DUF3820 family)
MEYLVFPFGKYKGVKLEDLPSTYIVLALEKFELPDELNLEIYNILLGRLGVFSLFKMNLEKTTIKEFSSKNDELRFIYEGKTPF